MFVKPVMQTGPVTCSSIFDYLKMGGFKQNVLCFKLLRQLDGKEIRQYILSHVNRLISYEMSLMYNEEIVAHYVSLMYNNKLSSFQYF